jgi:hypothetical protein
MPVDSMAGDEFEDEPDDAYDDSSDDDPPDYVHVDVPDDPTFEQSSDDVAPIKTTELRMQVPALEDRPARMISFEQEFGGDAGAVAESLYDGGYAEDRYVCGYHSGGGGFVRVEDDSSVDGEIIFSRLRLDHEATAAKLDGALDVVAYQLSNAESISLDSRCGFHVHVDAGYDVGRGRYKCLSVDAVQSLYHLWNYLEDTIFRLGSANWSRHRTERADYNYAPPTPKALTGARDIGRAMQRERGALNLGNFLAARSYCSCGAFDFGAWNECTCELEQPTVEFRVFNATANKRKIRAYIALCLALVAYAEQNTITEATHPVHEWCGTDMLDSERSQERLRFILRELPLTDVEREDLRYCAERSSLRFVAKKIRRRKGYDKAAVKVAA